MRRAQQFYREKIEKILSEKKNVLDIGGGLRALRSRGNRYDPSAAWMEPLLSNIRYSILDPTPEYKPDILGDIHHLPLADNSQDAIICISVLEHVEDPLRACRELYRVLQPGGYCFVYIPFLYYYHAERGYYRDYWRFTHDAIELLFKDFSHREVQPVRGALETLVRLTPFGRMGFALKASAALDSFFKKDRSKQASGYHVFLIK